MNNWAMHFGTLAVFVWVLPYASAQVTDAGQKVSDALNAIGPIPITTVVAVPRNVEHCSAGKLHEPDCVTETVYDQKRQVTNQILTASNVRVVKSDPLKFDPAVRTELPSVVSVNDSLVQNCTANPVTHQVSLQLAFQRSESIQFTEQVTHTLSVGLNFDLSITPIFKVGGSITIGESHMTGEVKTSGETDTTTVSRTETVSVNPQTSTVAELRVWPVHYSIPFHTVVTVDADLSQNDKSYHRLSDILDESKRTFPISGSVDANESSDGSAIFYNIPYDPSSCPNATVVVTKANYAPKRLTRISK